MKAYKFRSSSQLPFALDIVFNNRLYCSDWSNLNDPMEGMFVYHHHGSKGRDLKEEVAQIIKHKKQLKVCSLSKTFDCHLLWAHYASGFDGLAIEVELPDQSPVIKQVEYRGVFASVSLDNPIPPAQAAERVLSSKYQEWSYEQEVRVLQSNEWYQLPTPVRRIIAGHRMNPALFEALRIICERKKIMICRTGIGDEGIDADRVPPLSDNDGPEVGGPSKTRRSQRVRG
jgi:hypothetical protein